MLHALPGLLTLYAGCCLPPPLDSSAEDAAPKRDEAARGESDAEWLERMARGVSIALPPRVSVPLGGLADVEVMVRDPGFPFPVHLAVDSPIPGLVDRGGYITRLSNQGAVRVGAAAPLTVGQTFEIRVTARLRSLVRTAVSTATVVERTGTLDPNFAERGSFSVGCSKYGGGRLSDLHVLPDGSMLGTGPFDSRARSSFLILHPQSNGSPDPAWTKWKGWSSWVVRGHAVDLLLPGGSRDAHSFAIGRQSMGRIVVAGVDGSFGGSTRIALAGVRPEGLLDSTFGPGGVRFLSPGGEDVAALALAVAPDDTLFVGGHRGRRGMVARLTPDGAPDPRFGSAGFADVAFLSEVRAVAVDAGGQALALGDDGKHVFVAQLAPEGSSLSHLTMLPTPEPTDEATAKTLAVLSDGRILVGGSLRRGSASFVALWRLQENSVLDPGFRTSYAIDGLAAFPVAGAGDPMGGFTPLPDGRILIAVNADTGTDWYEDAQRAKPFLLRLLPNGQPDTRFGPHGFVRIALQQGHRVTTIDHTSDGKVVLGLLTPWELCGAIARVWD